jgi:hypothetical protein
MRGRGTGHITAAAGCAAVHHRLGSAVWNSEVQAAVMRVRHGRSFAPPSGVHPCWLQSQSTGRGHMAGSAADHKGAGDSLQLQVAHACSWGNRSTSAPQHRSTAAPQHRSTAAPQHRSTAQLMATAVAISAVMEARAALPTRGLLCGKSPWPAVRVSVQLFPPACVEFAREWQGRAAGLVQTLRWQRRVPAAMSCGHIPYPSTQCVQLL